VENFSIFFLICEDSYEDAFKGLDKAEVQTSLSAAEELEEPKRKKSSFGRNKSDHLFR